MWKKYWKKVTNSPIEKLIEWYKVKYGYAKLASIFPEIKGISLEVGAGKAYLSKILSDKGWIAWTSDLEEKDEEYYIQANAINLPFKNKYFDLAFSCGLLEHLSVNEGVWHLKEMQRVAKIAVAFYPSCDWKWKLLWRIRGVPQGKCLFTPTGKIKFFGLFEFYYIVWNSL